jgi:hypothetical protein
VSRAGLTGSHRAESVSFSFTAGALDKTMDYRLAGAAELEGEG